LHHTAPPQQQAKLELGRGMGWIEPEHAPQIRIGFLIPLEPAQNGATQNQEFGLVGTPTQAFREHVSGIIGFLEPVEEVRQV
jgi:hypothetical protein